ncbi:MAG TPA: CDP-alcohol phosphatidyltransferase family protein [Mycobacteriales bacterium]|nr:CDP-alcohol phosphatidyltransferase family protein [Mycobacteriales bacterium]
MSPTTGESPRRATPGTPSGQVLTIPNLLSVLRLAGVPAFLWLLLGPHADGWALAVLATSAVTDYLDGKLARWLGQTSRLGVLLDPAADRLYILATVIAFVARGIIPLWLAAVLVGRDAAVGVGLLVLRRHGYGPLPVHQLGKAATFALLYALPLLLLAAGHGTPSDVARPMAWAFTIWGTCLYLWAGLLYLVQVSRLTHATGSARTADPAGDPARAAGPGTGEEYR